MNLLPSFLRGKKSAARLANPFAAAQRRDRRAALAAFKATAEQRALARRHGGGRIHSMRAQPLDAEILRGIERKIVRMYAAALTTNLDSDFPISLTSSNAEILTSLIGVRSRARTQERNNGYASAIVWDWMRNIGGHDPFRLEMQVGSIDGNGKFTAEDVTNREIMAAWKEAGRKENCCVNGTVSRRNLYWTAIAATCRDGGILFRHHGALHDRAFPYNELGYAIEPLEIDRLDQNWQRPKTQSTNEIQCGIEFDPYGYKRPIVYHILTRHPGDVFAYSNEAKYREPVPAGHIIALFDIKTRPEQYVGMSRMAPIIRLMHQMEQFDIAHITAALTTCCKTHWIEKEYPSSPEFVPDHIKGEIQESLDAGGAGEDGDGMDSGWGGGPGQRMMNMAPGEFNELEWGQRVKVLDAHFPSEAAPAFKKDILRCMAAGTGVWYNSLSQDMESVNFASGRLGEGASRDMAMMSQEHLIDHLVFPHFTTWLKYWLLSGQTKLPFSRYKEFCQAAKFNGRRWAYTNPLQDVQADILTVEAGMDSRSHIISESPRGGNAEEVDREIEADRESDTAHNLDFSAADVTKPTISKGLPGEAKANPLDPDADGDEDGKPQTSNPKPQERTGVNLDRMERLMKIFAMTGDAQNSYGDYETLQARALKAERRCQELEAAMTNQPAKVVVQKVPVPVPVPAPKKQKD